MDERNNKRPTYDGFLTKALDPLTFKADAEKGILSGYASKFWSVDSYGEATAPGSFQRSITDRGPASASPRLLARYEHEYTIGAITAAQEDQSGPAIEMAISDDGMYGTAVRRQLADGVPYGLSIGFRRIAQRPATEDDPLDLTNAPAWVRQMAAVDVSSITVLTDIRWLETSVVSFPAVDNALVDSYRADDLNVRAIDRLWNDLHTGRLSTEHITQLKRLLIALPADVAPGSDRDDPSTTRAADSIGTRNYRAELLLAELGV
jgi:HK97 family phage prohead protease